jgi:hypothetical protein
MCGILAIIYGRSAPAVRERRWFEVAFDLLKHRGQSKCGGLPRRPGLPKAFNRSSPYHAQFSHRAFSAIQRRQHYLIRVLRTAISDCAVGRSWSSMKRSMDGDILAHYLPAIEPEDTPATISMRMFAAVPQAYLDS